MRPHGQAGAAEVGDQALFVAHGRERGGGGVFRDVAQQRSRATQRALHLPEGVAAVQGRFQVSSFTFHAVRIFGA